MDLKLMCAWRGLKCSLVKRRKWPIMEECEHLIKSLIQLLIERKSGATYGNYCCKNIQTHAHLSCLLSRSLSFSNLQSLPLVSEQNLHLK